MGGLPEVSFFAAPSPGRAKLFYINKNYSHLRKKNVKAVHAQDGVGKDAPLARGHRTCRGRHNPGHLFRIGSA
jgi:hypothetical protein